MPTAGTNSALLTGSGFGDIFKTSPKVTVELTHEAGTTVQNSTLEETRIIPPSLEPTSVHFKSNVNYSGKQRLSSPEYMATIRRQKAATIAKLVSALEEHSEAEDFVVHTLPVFEALRRAISSLADAEHEGNSREVLRVIRDSLLNGGWNNFRRSEPRNAVIDLLNDLATSEEVLPRVATESFDRLSDLGLTPVGLMIFPDGEEQDADGEGYNILD